MPRAEDIAQSLMGMPFDGLDEPARKVAHHIAGRRHITRNLARTPEVAPAFGERAADAVGAAGRTGFVPARRYATAP